MKPFAVVILAVGLLVGCSTTKEVTGRAQVTDEELLSALPTTKPTIVYVADFELDVSEMKSHERLLPGPGLLQRPLNRLRGQPNDPAAYAEKLVDLMSTTLITRLGKAQVPAQRVLTSDPLPKDGWIIRGVFTEVDEGNRLRRAVIGFGAGETKLNLYVAVDDLSSNAVQPFYSFDTTKGSGKMPGAIITLNPYVAAAKFVMSRDGLEKDTKKTAAKIADQVSSQIKKIQQSEPNPGP